MASRRLSISTKLPRYTQLPTKDDGDLESVHLALSPASRSPSCCSPADTTYPPSSPRKSSKRPLKSPGPALIPPSFDVPWRRERALHGRLRWVALGCVGMVGIASVVCFGAAYDIPVLGFARSWGMFKPERIYDREEAYRAHPTTLVDGSEFDNIPFLLDRFGYASAPTNSDPIPSIMHVVPPGKGVFSYLQWLSITSGVSQIQPAKTLAHMINGTVPPPGTNFWWDETIKLPGLQVHVVPDITEVFGNPLRDVSHKADVIRMRALLEHGGVYIDTDVLVTRGFQDLMSGREEMIMGVEQAHGSAVQPVQIEGLCNAVLVVKKGSRFLRRWWEEYRHFNGMSWQARTGWNYHSVQLPWLLAKNASLSRTPITILDHGAFFAPLWDEQGMMWVHGTLESSSESSDPSTSPPSAADPLSPDEPPSSRFRHALADLDSPLSTDFAEEDVPLPPSTADPELLQHGLLSPDKPGWSFEHTGQFAYHMWHHLLIDQIGTVTQGSVESEADLGVEDALGRDSSFNRVARKYLSAELVGRYRKWKKKMEALDKEKAKERSLNLEERDRWPWGGSVREMGSVEYN